MRITTPTIEGRKIVSYQGIVSGEVVTAVEGLKDVLANMRKLEDELADARKHAIAKLTAQAEGKGANAVVGVSVGYAALGANDDKLIVAANGTAVTCAMG